MNEEIVQLLWTGGWDSTFRLVELSRQAISVQPIYLYGDGRQSIDYEVNAMQKILDRLLEKSGTRAHIYPLVKVDIATIPQNQAITDAYKNIISKHKLGSQYEWIARYAATNPGLEIGVEKPHENGIGYMQKLIANEGCLMQTGDMHRFRVETSSRDVSLILGNVYFPLMGLTEQEMLRKINEWGYQDVMKYIWFCHTPIKGQPCGMCRPCCEKMEADMTFLLEDRVRIRNRVYKMLGEGKFSKLYQKVIRSLCANR